MSEPEDTSSANVRVARPDSPSGSRKFCEISTTWSNANPPWKTIRPKLGTLNCWKQNSLNKARLVSEIDQATISMRKTNNGVKNRVACGIRWPPDFIALFRSKRFLTTNGKYRSAVNSSEFISSVRVRKFRKKDVFRWLQLTRIVNLSMFCYEVMCCY